MDLAKLQDYIKKYKADFESISREEIYKWQAIKHFQQHYKENAKNFPAMLETALSKTKNLMDTGSYFPRAMIIGIAQVAPNEVKNLFHQLYNQDVDRIQRIENFRNQIRAIHSKFIKIKQSTFQDHRAITVYLTLMYPEDNYFYKFRMFKQFNEKIDFGCQIKAGDISNIIQFYSICDFVKSELIKDNDLIKKHLTRLGSDEYADVNFNILTQDFIYAVTNHLNNSTIVNNCKNLLSQKSISFGVMNKMYSFKGRQTNFERKHKENKRLGFLGEKLVLQEEKKAKSKYQNKITHDSELIGDGIGYDIKSVDNKGNPIFIEVKTTRGAFNTPFFISSHELERSKQAKNQYYLYRLFNFDETSNTADFCIIPGDLSSYCNNPRSFEVLLK